MKSVKPTTTTPKPASPTAKTTLRADPDVPSSEAAVEPDAVDLLIQDHRRVAHLFADFEAIKASGSDDAKARLVRQICEELTVHVQLEEELFYPEARKAIDDDDLMDEALVEQAGAKDLVAKLRDAMPDEELYDARVTVLCEQVEHHVEEEEKDMFLRVRASDLDAFELASRMRARREELVAARAGRTPDED